MSIEETKPAAHGRAPRKRKFFIVDASTASRASGFELTNGANLFTRGPPILCPPDGRRGFRDYPELPVFVADPKRGRLHWDLEVYSGYWFVSEQMKSVLQTVDPGAFTFLQCDVQSPDGRPQPVRWLCDVVRVLDALDEGQSETTNRVADDGSKYYSGVTISKLVFRESVVGNSHVFRLKFFDAVVMCDQDLRAACKAAGLKGISFRPTE